MFSGNVCRVLSRAFTTPCPGPNKIQKASPTILKIGDCRALRAGQRSCSHSGYAPEFVLITSDVQLVVKNSTSILRLPGLVCTAKGQCRRESCCLMPGKTRGEDVLSPSHLRHVSQSAGAWRPRYVCEILVNWSPGIYTILPLLGDLANQCCQ